MSPNCWLTRKRARARARKDAVGRADTEFMQLDHERLDVYEPALDFLVLTNGIIEELAQGAEREHSHTPIESQFFRLHQARARA